MGTRRSSWLTYLKQNNEKNASISTGLLGQLLKVVTGRCEGAEVGRAGGGSIGALLKILSSIYNTSVTNFFNDLLRP